MLIHRLHLENFQSIREPTTFDLAPITLLYGPNSAGKSAVGDAIELLGSILTTAGELSDASNWLHMRDLSRRMVIGIGGSQHGELANTIEFYNLGHLAGSPFGYAFDEETRMPLHVATGLFEGESGFDDPKLPRRGDTELDVLVEIATPGPRLDRLRVLIDGEQIACLADHGRTVSIALDHPKFSSSVGLEQVRHKLTEAALAVRNMLPPEYQRLVSVADSQLEISSLFVPINNLGLVDQFTSVTPGLAPHGDNWTQAEEEIDGGGLGDTLLDTFLMAADPQSLNLLRQILVGLIIIPCRLVGTAAQRLLRLGPLREVPTASQLVCSPASHDTLHSKDAPSGWARGWSAWTELAMNPTVESWSVAEGDYGHRLLVQVVNEWLSSPQRLDMGYEVRVATFRTQSCDADAQLQLPSGYPVNDSTSVAVYLWDQTLAFPVSPHDVGTGVAQVIPVLVARASNVLWCFVEQPELHLHPRLQAQLADFFVGRVRIDDHNDTYHCSVIETHSEHFALRLLRRIRETAVADVAHRDFSLRPSDVAFYYFEPSDGVTTVHRLRVDEQGRFVDRWPRGFFDERAEDLFDNAD